MAKSGGGAGRGYLRYEDLRSGRVFTIPQADGTRQPLRFNKQQNRYEYMDRGRFAMNQWKPLSNMSSEFQSNDIVEYRLRQAFLRKMRFL